MSALVEEQVQVDPFHQAGSDVKSVEVVLRGSLLQFVRNGGGLMAIHYAAGGNRHWPEFAKLLGAGFDGHPWNEAVGMKLDEPDHPLVQRKTSDRLAEDASQLLKNVRNDDWNEYRLTTRGGRTILKINGVAMCDVIDRDPRVSA